MWKIRKIVNSFKNIWPTSVYIWKTIANLMTGKGWEWYTIKKWGPKKFHQINKCSEVFCPGIRGSTCLRASTPHTQERWVECWWHSLSLFTFDHFHFFVCCKICSSDRSFTSHHNACSKSVLHDQCNSGQCTQQKYKDFFFLQLQQWCIDDDDNDDDDDNYNDDNDLRWGAPLVVRPPTEPGSTRPAAPSMFMMMMMMMMMMKVMMILYDDKM